MPQPKPNKINEQTSALLADTAMRTDCDIKRAEERVKRASATRAKASVAAAAALASSAPGRGSASSMPPPLKAPPYSKPPPPDLPSAPPIKAVPTSKPQPPTPSALGPSPSSFQDAGGRFRGQDLGGTLIPESTAGSAFTSYHMPVGPVGKSIATKRAADKDRPLQTFPRSAFHFVPDEDPPILRVLAGPQGPGWFSKLWHAEQ